MNQSRHQDGTIFSPNTIIPRDLFFERCLVTLVNKRVITIEVQLPQIKIWQYKLTIYA